MPLMWNSAVWLLCWPLIAKYMPIAKGAVTFGCMYGLADGVQAMFHIGMYLM